MPNTLLCIYYKWLERCIPLENDGFKKLEIVVTKFFIRIHRSRIDKEWQYFSRS